MTSNELKELVKQHFSLTEAPTPEVAEETSNEAFGEIMDENKAFTIIFPGDKIEVGDEVRVRTADGQELTAPDGEHRLEDGAMIKVEDGKVVEYTSEAEIEEREGEELAVDGEVEQPESIEGVDVEKMAGETEEEEEMMEDMPAGAEDVVKAIVEAISDEMKSIKEEMEALKAKMAEYEDSPATEKAMPEMMNENITFKPTADVFNSQRFNHVMERFSKK
jgi:hypothetical protein